MPHQASIPQTRLLLNRPRTRVSLVGYAVPWFVRMTFYAFVFTIPLDSIGISLGIPGAPFSVPQILGLLFALMFCFYINRLAKFPPVAFFFLGFYYFLLILHLGITPDEHYRYLLRRLLQMSQLIALFWMAFIVLMDPRIVRMSLKVFCGSCIFLCTAILFQIPGFTAIEKFEDVGRETFANADPNLFSFLLGLAVLVIFTIMVNQYQTDKKINYLMFIPVLLLLYYIVASGSRGGALSFVSGIMVYLWASKESRGKHLKWGVSIFALILIIVLSLKVELAETRWQQSLLEGRLGNRERLFPEAVKLTLMRPLLGWGPEKNLRLLGEFWGRMRGGPHNTFLFVSTEMGFVGLIPFAVGWVLIGISCWRTRDGTLGNLPFAIFVLILVANNTVDMIYMKPTWFFLALCAASVAYSKKKFRRALASLSGEHSDRDQVTTGPYHVR